MFTSEQLVEAGDDDDGHGEKFTERQEDLQPGCPAHTNTVNVHDRSWKIRKFIWMSHILQTSHTGKDQ